MATFRWIESPSMVKAVKVPKSEQGKFIVCDGISRTKFDTYEKAADYIKQMREADDDNKS